MGCLLRVITWGFLFQVLDRLFPTLFATAVDYMCIVAGRQANPEPKFYLTAGLLTIHRYEDIPGADYQVGARLHVRYDSKRNPTKVGVFTFHKFKHF